MTPDEIAKGKNLCFVTTTLFSKWLGYSQSLLKKEFPLAQYLVVDGRKDWPRAWFFWIKQMRDKRDFYEKVGVEYFIHVDDDFFLTNGNELRRVIVEKMDKKEGKKDGEKTVHDEAKEEQKDNKEKENEGEKYDLMACSDGYHHYRGANPVAFNTFLMIGKIHLIWDLHKERDFTDIQFQFVPEHMAVQLSPNSSSKQHGWFNSYGLVFQKGVHDKDFVYPHEKQGGENYLCEQEPYYAFMWQMKNMGAKFGYLYPRFDGERLKSTNPALDKASKEIGTHLWYVRQWDSQMDVHGLPNVERYKRAERMIKKLL